MAGSPEEVTPSTRLRHDLRTRLNQIIGYSEMLLEDTPGAGSDILRTINASARELVMTIEGLLPTSFAQFDLEQLNLLRAGLLQPVSQLLIHARELSVDDSPDFKLYASQILRAATALEDFVSGQELTENPAGSERTEGPGRLGQARLLIVDDDASNRQLLSSQIRRMNYEVSTATNGRDALELLRGGTFDVVLLDVRMPEMDGFQILGILQADEKLREMPVIMISATDEYESVIRCIEGGAEDYLIKPFDAILLRARLKASLEKKSLRDQQRQRAAELEIANRDLRKMQDQLVTQEKLASLGTLAAGIAHEIKNPLNFITNFASLSRELTTELSQSLRSGDSADAEETIKLLEQNLAKIEEHGKRADRVVRGMLLHARKQPGQKDRTDLNALATECLNLAYHGLRSQDMTFNAVIETHLDDKMMRIDVFPQDMSRVFINLFANAFYAVHEQKKRSGPEYRPTVRLTTHLGEKAEISIRDNGGGIPDADVKKIFEPFYTTKPSDAGTGLGLSISREIVCGEHGGELRVLSEEGKFAEFIVSLPLPPR